MPTANIKRSINVDGVEVSGTEAQTATQVTGFIEETVADAVTDGQINIAIDVSAVKALILVSDQAVTIETNNGTTPDDTIVLVANKPYLYVASDYATFLFTVDVTAFFVTNASGSTATISCKVLQDPSP